MIDLHCHLIPNMDDGAQDLEEAVSMMRISAESGTKGIVATPHVIEGKWLPSWPDIVTKCRQLQTVAKSFNINLAIYPGAEVCVNWDILTTISGPGPYCINGSQYMLVELPAVEIPGFTDDFLFTLQMRGITPILAHPERHPAIIKEPRILAKWINRGMLAQVNGSSLTGRFGDKVMHMAQYLLFSKMVHCFGSDGHGARIRKPGLVKPAEKIRALFDEAHVEQWLVYNPKLIICNRELEIRELPDMKPMGALTGIRSRLSRLFG